MLKSSGAMAAATMTSRLLGMVREMAYANFMGDTPVASAFILAFQVPNLFRRLLGEGALTAAFIPIFKRKEATEGETAMWRSANAVISGLLIAAGAITVLAIIVISVLLMTHRFKPENRLTLQLLRFMFPYMLLACLAAVLIGMANARGHFFVPALGSALLNVVMIGSVWLLAPLMGTTLQQQIFGLAIGVIVAGMVQAMFQVPTLMREGFRFTWVQPSSDPTVREVVRKMLPGSIGVAAFQINVLLTQLFAYWVDKSIVADFNYAVRLMELPQGMFGISLATYLLPTLSGLAAEKKYPEFRNTLSQGLGHLAFANLIAAAVSIALAQPIVRLLFQHGEFGPSSTPRVAGALACLAPGLLMFSMNNILARAFYALHDIKTPMKISVFCLGLNLVLAVWLVQELAEKGLGIANTLSATVNACLLLFTLRKKMKFLAMSALVRTIGLLVVSAVLAFLAAVLLRHYWSNSLGHSTLPLKIGEVFVPMSVAGLVYWCAALAFRVPQAQELVAFLRQKLTPERQP